MGRQLKKKPKQLKLSPNWVQLQQKLKNSGSMPLKPSNKSKSENPESILGKRKVWPNEESNDSQINPLTPIKEYLSLTDAVAMDCEMVGVSHGNKSALGRVTLVNRWGNVIYDEFVRPVERVVDFRTKISGIRPRDLRKGHALHNDLKALLLSHPKKDLRDTSEYQPFLKESSRRSLKHLAAEFLGVEIQNGEHCPIEDARAAMLLYQRSKKEWEKSVKDQFRLKQKQKKRKHRKKRKEEVALNVNG
ncbi:RNA exonuclease 4 [Quillaja saponaria]|uniref:RNA exonuclease 4 n=1 Tax=Quillaja saponaria TaxID=32244 RepID=A0AAD7PBG0_QUISA|nr:RNA exonuclease 4 [Quillaja saponaria]